MNFLYSSKLRSVFHFQITPILPWADGHLELKIITKCIKGEGREATAIPQLYLSVVADEHLASLLKRFNDISFLPWMLESVWQAA